LDLLANPETWIALLTLTALEIVLGIDNIIFISILVAKLQVEQQARARVVGLGLAMFMRLALSRRRAGVVLMGLRFETVIGEAFEMWHDDEVEPLDVELPIEPATLP